MDSPNESNPYRRMMHITLIITELNVGGAERCLVNLATGLDRTLFHPSVVSLGRRPSADQSSLVDQLEARQIPVHFLNAAAVWDARHALASLRSLLQHQQPDVVQTFLFHANVLGCWAARHPSLADVAVVAGIRVAERRWLRMSVERLALRRAAKVVCVSDSVAHFASGSQRLPPHKLIVIPNGIHSSGSQVEPANLEALGIKAHAPVVLFVGRLEKQKGIDWLLRVARQFLAELPDGHLVLAGDGGQRSALQRQASHLPAADRVHFVGWRADVPNLLRRCQVLVLPSRWEGMPNVVLEAMAAERPVVATRAEGVEQLLGDAAGDQTVDFGDDPALNERLLQLAGDSEFASRIGAANRIRAMQGFSVQSMVERYQSLYRSLRTG